MLSAPASHISYPYPNDTKNRPLERLGFNNLIVHIIVSQKLMSCLLRAML